MRRARTPRHAGPVRPARARVARLALLPLLAAACAGPATPPLAASTPADGAIDVSPGAWIELAFAGRVPAAGDVAFSLACAGESGEHALGVHRLGAERLLLNPAGSLPAGDTCALAWRAGDRTEVVRFATARAGLPVAVLHDRTDPGRVAPYPDDVLLAAGATPTGRRHAVPVPDASPEHGVLFGALLREANRQDGFSPIAPMVIELSDAVDPASLPRTPAEALDPLASVALLDLTPWSPDFGRRVPFRIEVRNGDTTPFGLRSNTLLLFPSIPLAPHGRYGLYVTRRVEAGPGRPLAPSAYFRHVLGAPEPGEHPAVARNRAVLAGVLRAGERFAQPPIPRDDLAFAAGVSVRSLEGIQDDAQRMRRHVLAAPPPAVHVDPADPDAVVADPAPHVAALVRGTWDAPDWRDGPSLARDGAGRPVVTGSRPVCFRLALPEAARAGPVPVVIYQHGNPGEAETEVLAQAARFLARAGYAVIGFTDVLNRELAPPSPEPGSACVGYEMPVSDDESRMAAQLFAIGLGVLADSRVPEPWSQTLGEQLAFVRAVQGLADLDLLPLGAPDGVPDLEPAGLLYMGVSEGANHGQALLAYAPEVRAASLVVGGGRLVETLLHQQAAGLLRSLPLLFPALTPADLWTAASLLQVTLDRQDPHNHARFVYRRPAEVPVACPDLAACLDPQWCRTSGACTRRKASILLTEGVGDSVVPNHATASAAWQLGVPQLAPAARVVPFLDRARAPLAANVDTRTTGALYQYVPADLSGHAATPGCQSPPLPARSAGEGHFCAQSAVESLAQRLLFFESALDPARAAPVLVNPLPLFQEAAALFPLPDPS